VQILGQRVWGEEAFYLFDLLLTKKTYKRRVAQLTDHSWIAQGCLGGGMESGFATRLSTN